MTLNLSKTQKCTELYKISPYISEKQDEYVKLFWCDDFVLPM